jgi:anaerobic selenocysteine-containing dehydrogenase
MHDYAPIRELIAAVYPEIYTGFNERIQQPHGFHLDIPPRRRVWPTPNGKANILVMPGLDVDDPVDDPDMLRLATVRSHDQYNTTIYSYNDRYRGVYNDRMVLFMNIEDRLARGLEKEALVSLETISGDGVQRRIEGLTVLDYPMPRGALAGYYPELNPLLPLDYYDRISGTRRPSRFRCGCVRWRRRLRDAHRLSSAGEPAWPAAAMDAACCPGAECTGAGACSSSYSGRPARITAPHRTRPRWLRRLLR